MRIGIGVAGMMCLLGAPPAWGGYAAGVDRGTVLSANGIVPLPGQGSVPFPGGNTNAAYTFFGFNYYAYGVTAFDANGLQRAVQNGADLTPAAYQFSGILSIQPDRQQLISDGYDEAGYAGGSCTGTVCVTGPSHAAVWNELSNSFTDLHPSGFVSSVAQALDGLGVVVGQATDSAGVLHPYLWSGTTPLALARPAHFKQAAVAAIAGLSGATPVDVLGGYGTAKNGQTHPVIWSLTGTQWAAFDALPQGAKSGAIVAGDPADTMARFGGSVITSTSKGQYHAAYWLNPAKGAPGFTDLHPAGSQYVASWVYCASASYGLQGGAALVRSGRTKVLHAMVWSGSAASAIDLQALLGTGFSQSVVTGIDAYGNAEGAAQDGGGVWHLVSWGYSAPGR